MDKICVKPVDDVIRVRVEALNILNNFKILGFDTKGKFINVVQETLSEYKNFQEFKELNAFWDGRHNKDGTNKKLSALIEQLKSE